MTALYSKFISHNDDSRQGTLVILLHSKNVSTDTNESVNMRENPIISQRNENSLRQANLTVSSS